MTSEAIEDLRRVLWFAKTETTARGVTLYGMSITVQIQAFAATALQLRDLLDGVLDGDATAIADARAIIAK